MINNFTKNEIWVFFHPEPEKRSHFFYPKRSVHSLNWNGTSDLCAWHKLMTSCPLDENDCSVQLLVVSAISKIYACFGVEYEKYSLLISAKGTICDAMLWVGEKYCQKFIYPNLSQRAQRLTKCLFLPSHLWTSGLAAHNKWLPSPKLELGTSLGEFWHFILSLFYHLGRPISSTDSLNVYSQKPQQTLR